MIDEFARFLHDCRQPIDLGHWGMRLRADPVFAAEMRVCREWSISHSQFLGWSEVDREKALAYVIHEGQRCKDCGIHPEDWPVETDEPLYEVDATRCFGCQTIQNWLDNYQRKSANADGSPNRQAMWGLRTSLRPTEE